MPDGKHLLSPHGRHTPPPRHAPRTRAGRLILAENEAETDAGILVDGDEIMRELDETIARMDAEPAATPRRKAAGRR
jgi:hypothetical protein